MEEDLHRLIGVGSNLLGQLGLDQITEAKQLIMIPTVAVKDVACDIHNTVIIDVIGNSWGNWLW